MNDLKITIDQLKNYLGTGLKFQNYGEFEGIREWIVDSAIFKSKNGSDIVPISKVNPLCYRLSDLDKFIPELGFMPIEEIKKITKFSKSDQVWLMNQNGFKTSLFLIIEKLFQWHFWPFGEEYFERGLVIDKLKHREGVSNG